MEFYTRWEEGAGSKLVLSQNFTVVDGKGRSTVIQPVTVRLTTSRIDWSADVATVLSECSLNGEYIRQETKYGMADMAIMTGEGSFISLLRELTGHDFSDHNLGEVLSWGTSPNTYRARLGETNMVISSRVEHPDVDGLVRHNIQVNAEGAWGCVECTSSTAWETTPMRVVGFYLTLTACASDGSDVSITVSTDDVEKYGSDQGDEPGWIKSMR